MLNKLDLVDQSLLQANEIKALGKKDDSEFHFEEVKAKIMEAVQAKLDQVRR